MDSAVTLAEAKAAGFEPFALSFRYGQRHEVELAAARRVAAAAGVTDHRIVDLDLSALGGSSLVEAADDVPKDRDFDPAGPDSPGTEGAIPSTYVPARNTVFLAVALGWAETLGARHLFLGVNAVDYSGYPDCRPEFLRAFARLAAVATAAGTEEGAAFHVEAPLLHASKADIVLRAAELGVDLGLTHTCYDPVVEPAGSADRALACGRCDACRLRLAGFAEAGVVDPVPYVAT